MNAIELKNVTFTYGKSMPGATPALDDVSIEVKSGGITGLIGHTGSGKSTLVQLLNGLLKPDSGTVLLDGIDIWAEPKKIREVRFKAGLVMQYPEYQLFAETVAEDIGFGPKNMGLNGAELDARVKEAARFSGIPEELLSKSPFDLSGGQKRRVALAGVIAMNPKILILDEPAAGLDPAGRRDILGGVKRFSRESGTTVLIVSHSMEDMAMYCDDIIVMAKAKILMHRPTAEVFSRAEELSAVGLDVPLITRVAAALQKEGVDIGLDVYTVDYAVEQILSLL
ncbi:MAG: energy-coupling factor transporter ATPase [Ruminococcaceae bacterium]|jgi:energy-coupling factor transport system ATP-binding protein|nr:energy-coupling factor transporter ATPase [Oscillospiraceae bacterium]